MAKYEKNEVLDFYIKFSEFNDMSQISYLQRSNDTRSRALRQIKAGEVSLFKTQIENLEDLEPEDLPSADNLRVLINNQIAGFLSKKISPIVKAKNGDVLEDQNKLFLALAFCKVFFEDKDTHAYFPLIMLDITEEKERLYKEARFSGVSNLDINFKKDLIINEEVVNFFFDIEFEENGDSFMEYIATNIDDFIPEVNRNSVANILNYIYDYFNSKKKEVSMEIMFPSVTSDKSSAFMFFSSKSSFKSRQEFGLIKNEDAPLVTEYLEFEQEENKHSSIDNSIWWGSLTRDFPLGQGQAIVLQENQKDTALLPVVGGPGTGKTTLFLSAVSNEVTKRAMSLIYDKKDYNNMILVTSTSNKAIENVYKSLKSGFKHGFCYVGGNTTNRIESASEVAEFIAKIESEEFSQKKLEKYESSVKRIVDYIKRKESEFKEIKSYSDLMTKFKIKDFSSLANAEEALLEDLKGISEEDFKDTLNEISKFEKKASHLVENDFTFEDMIEMTENGILEKLEITVEKLTKSSFFTKMFKFVEKELAKIEEVSVKDLGSLEVFVNLLKEVDSSKERLSKILSLKNKFQELKNLSMFTVKYGAAKKSFNSLLKNDTFGEYFRLNLFSLNYKLYLQAYNYLYQVMLKKKSSVIKAVSYLAETDNQFQYLIDNFGTGEKQVEEFLKLISLAYPVVTSTLAAIGNMFPGIQPKKNMTYNTILADESGMIAANDIIPALRRSNRAIIVGDPKQLAPIVAIEDAFLDTLKQNYSEEFWNQYSPSVVSAFHRSAGTKVGGFKATGRGVILDEHRRCSPQIAELFIKVAEYEGLKVCTPKPKGQPFKNINEQGLMFFDIKNPDQKTFKKVNEGEMEVIETLIRRFEAAGYNPKKDIGIITPYKDQEASLIRRFGERLDHNPNEEAKIGTVHKFQGVEYKVVIFSSVLSRPQDSLSFVNIDPSLINVAVSRAKECYVTVGDFERLTSEKKDDNYIGIMAEYMKENGLYVKMKG